MTFNGLEGDEVEKVNIFIIIILLLMMFPDNTPHLLYYVHFVNLVSDLYHLQEII